ncbi:MAG: hypothetical protein IH959_01060 [Chloroflexi bacterium]|nr:hypothetical protein [Chloroflexota bacterium]
MPDNKNFRVILKQGREYVVVADSYDQSSRFAGFFSFLQEGREVSLVLASELVAIVDEGARIE